MPGIIRSFPISVSIGILLLVAVCGAPAAESPLPEFGHGTVLIWKIEGMEYEGSFVARLASFLPNRFFEWENETGQGTVLLRERAIADSGKYETSSLFTVGREKETRNETALWLSRRVFEELKEKQSARWTLNGGTSRLKFIDEGIITVEVNRNTTKLPIIRAADDRNAVWSFLDQPENPLMVRYELRDHSQTLSSVTTGAVDALRWIKGRKLPD